MLQLVTISPHSHVESSTSSTSRMKCGLTVTVTTLQISKITEKNDLWQGKQLQNRRCDSYNNQMSSP